ncbi:MAG TPA: MYXO-CTERM sorting domain-containing protein [Polyangia bacterium]|nr:MYXO-CTERM sorting domain-containing protein [Polyangia bacterium]
MAAARVCWLVWAGLLALTSRALAQAPPAVTISVDATAPGAPLERIWPFHGYDEINYTTLPEGAALLQDIVAAHSAPVHVRNHFLLNTGDGTPAMKWGSTNVYTEDAAGNPVYSWTLTDGIMDTITGAGAFPFVEIGFMPEALSTHPVPYQNSSTTALDGGCFYPPTDYTKWADLVGAWAMHASARYPDVAQRWLWELWNEPDIGYWNGTPADYQKLYDYTESALHAALPDAALGGPAVAGPAGSFMAQFLDHCATGTNAVTGQTGTRLDLVTFHAKGGVAVTGGHVEMDLGTQLREHRAGFAAVAAHAQLQATPIYVTEADPDGCAACPVSGTPADAYRFSPAYGAYEIAMMKHSLELEAEVGVKLGGLLTWAFTFPGTPYFAGYRVLGTNGIHLPVMGAFELLGRLAGARLPLTSSGAIALDTILGSGVRDAAEVDGMATLDGGAVQVLVWNYHDDLVEVAATPVHLAIALPAGFGAGARVSHLRVDESHGDAYTVWVALGMPAAPTTPERAALAAAMDPAPLVPDATVAVLPDGALALDFDLPRFGVSLITIQPAAGPGDGGADAAGQDAATPPPGHAGGGCGCGVGGPDARAPNRAAWLGFGLLVAAISRRRR